MAVLALGGKLEKGFDFVAQTLKLEENMKGCDLVITGEGKLDDTSREGKAPSRWPVWRKKWESSVWESWDATRRRPPG